jgi:hypothetical protein
LEDHNGANRKPRRQESSDAESSRTHVEGGSNGTNAKHRWGFFRSNRKNKDGPNGAIVEEGTKEKGRPQPKKKIPVFFLDEAHKL